MNFRLFNRIFLYQVETIELHFPMMSKKKDTQKELRLFLLVNFICLKWKADYLVFKRVEVEILV